MEDEKFHAFQVLVYDEDTGTIYKKDILTAKTSKAAEVHVMRELDAEAPDSVTVIIRPFH